MSNTNNKKQNNNHKKTKGFMTNQNHDTKGQYQPPTLGQSLSEIFSITGTNVDFSKLAQPKGDKRVFQDEIGTFRETKQKKDEKDGQTIAE